MVFGRQTNQQKEQSKTFLFKYMKNFITLTLLLLFCITLYTLTVRGQFGNLRADQVKGNLDQATKPFELSPERGRYILTLSLSEYKSFALTQELADAAFPDIGYYKGRYYLYFAPGISLLSLPLFNLGKNFNLSQVAAFFTISLFATLNLLLIFKIAYDIFKSSSRTALISAFIFGFASTSWSYAITLYQHHVTTFFILSSFYAVWRYKQSKKWGWVWGAYIWFACSYSIFIDYPNVFLMLPVMIYYVLSSISIDKIKNRIQISLRKTFLITSLIFILFNLGHAYYNQVNFGDWKKVSGKLPSYKKIKEQKALTNGQTEKIVKELQEKKTYSRFFKEERLPTGLSILLFAVDKGIFLFSPIFILSIFGMLIVKKIDLKLLTLYLTIAVNLFLYSSFGDPWGGWAYGPRYLIPSMAILSIFVGVWLTNTKHLILSRLVTLILFCYSSFIALLGALTTNQVPPKVEADFLKMKYNFLLNWDYFIDGRSGSFIFNEFASKYMNLQQYFLLIYIPLILIVFTLLFIVPLFEKKGIKKPVPLSGTVPKTN